MAKLSDYASIVMGQSPSGDSCNPHCEGLPLLNGPTEFGSSHPTANQWTVDVKRSAIPGDLLFCVRGSTTGRMNWADQKYAIGRGLAAIQHKLGVEYQPWIKGVVEYQLENLLAAATGSTFPNVSKDQLFGLSVPDHSYDEQREIAAILGAVDDKIEVNRKAAATQEAMARALYRSWFVDFDPVHAKAEGRQPAHMDAATAALFPDRFGDNGLPLGWESVPYLDSVEIVSGGTPKTSEQSYWGGDIPWYSVVDAPNGGDVFVHGTEKNITQAGFDNSAVKMVSRGTTIISARGTVGKLAMAGRDMVFNQSCYGLRGRKSRNSAFVYFTTEYAVEHLQSMAHGSVFATITRKTFESLELNSAPSAVNDAYDQLAVQMLDRIHVLGRENVTLANLRDTLLPRLMSGELRVGAAEKIVSEAV
jgi:type I restriction enzyme S subunit